jgi:hypothetical protein
MKKIICLVALLGVFISAHAQAVKPIKEGNLTGLEILDQQNFPVSKIRPAYDELEVFSMLSIGGIILGNSYVTTRMWNDTEFIEVPIDPNDASRTVTDTFVKDIRYMVEGTNIWAKKAGKWGLINTSGEVLIPFEFEKLDYIRSTALVATEPASVPYLLAFKEGKFNIYNQKGTLILTQEFIPSHFFQKPAQETLDMLEFSYFGDYIITTEGATLVDSLVKVPAKKQNNKIVAQAYSYHVYFYRGGKLNVWQASTGKLLFEKAPKNLEIHFQDEKGTDYFEPLNVRSFKSIEKFSENNANHLVPQKISFIPKD